MRTIAVTAIFIGFITGASHAGSISRGPESGPTSRDSTSLGQGSVWVPYQMGADSAGLSGSGTTVRYNPTGAVLETWRISGNVDGLKVDPSTGLVWALQGSAGDTALTLIDPVTNGTHGSSYMSTADRGFDDVVFSSGQVFLNPAAAIDPAMIQSLTSPAVVASILTAVNDQGSTRPISSGEFDLTGEADQPIVFVENRLQNAVNDAVSSADTGGYFVLADIGANTAYVLTIVGLSSFAFVMYWRKIRQPEGSHR
jgi:hypothetical protein